MALFGRKRSSIGLDIGSGFVKVVEVDHSGDQPEVTRVAMRPLLPDAIVEGEIMDYGLVSDAVMGLFQEIGLKGKEVTAKISGSRTTVIINGKPDKRKNVKPGMTCTVTWPKINAEAKKIDCKG